MDCQAITLGEHLLWEVLFKNFGYKNGRPWGRPFLLEDGADPGQDTVYATNSQILAST